mgnify:CR=1 FL=1
MIYQRPKMEIIELEKEEDIICNSGNSDYHDWSKPGDDVSDAGGEW